MKIGYIARLRDEDGKESFKYNESTATRKISTRSDVIKCKMLYGSIPYEEVKDNTDMINENKGIMLVSSPFFTDSDMKERAERWCEWANSCRNKEYEIF